LVQQYLTKSSYSTANNSFLSPAKCNLLKMKALLRQDRFQPAADMEEVKMVDLKVAGEELQECFQKWYRYWQENVTVEVGTCNFQVRLHVVLES